MNGEALSLKNFGIALSLTLVAATAWPEPSPSPPPALKLDATGLALSFMLVAACLILLWVERLKVKGEVSVGALRCFMQLLLVGYLIDFSFRPDNLRWMPLLIAAMMAIGAHTAQRRARGVARPWLVSFGAIAAGTAVSLGVLFAFRIVSFEETRHLIPLAGIVIGNATTRLSIGFERLHGELAGRRAEVEVALALGADEEQAARPARLAALRASLIPTIDGMKIIGLVQLPGAMLGMLLAGATAFEAVMLQIVVVYLLLSSNTVTLVIGLRLAYRSYFTPAGGLR